MKKSKFTGEQIAFALRQAEVGTPVAEVCRKMGVSEATYYHWKQLYGGLASSLRQRRQWGLTRNLPVSSGERNIAMRSSTSITYSSRR